MRRAVLWGHHANEYKEMFDLNDDHFSLPLLEYGCGPSALNSTVHDKNSLVVSIDPLFSLGKSDLLQKTTLMFDERALALRSDPLLLDVTAYGGLDAFIAYRKQGMALFFKDYEQGLTAKRYRADAIDSLPFDDFTFNMALSSHYFFGDGNIHSVDDTLSMIKSLARVAKEVRIFPLLNRPSVTSEQLGPVLLGLQQNNYGVEVREVACSLYPAGNAMLRIWAQECVI